MNIIGHRGIAGLELENTSSSLYRALALGVRVVEIDVRLTKDQRLVLCHDDSLSRIANNSMKTSQHTLSELQRVELTDGSILLSLEQALKIIGSTEVIIDLKDEHSESSLLKTLSKFPKVKANVASFKHLQLAALKEKQPKIRVYALEHTNAIEVIQVARSLNFDGVGLNFWILHPLAYWLARRAKLELYVYTVNNRFLAWFLGALYPKVVICTDHPEWFLPKRNKRSTKTANR